MTPRLTMNYAENCALIYTILSTKEARTNFSWNVFFSYINSVRWLEGNDEVSTPRGH